jgi:hypothetical protein
VRSERFRPAPGTIGGLLAIAVTLIGAATESTGREAATDHAGLTLILVFVAGVIALARPRLIEALAVADVLMSIAITIEMLGRLGVLYLPVTLVLLYATAREHHTVEREVAAKHADVWEERAFEPVIPAIRPMLGAEWDKQQREAREAEAEALRQSGSGEALRRAG